MSEIKSNSLMIIKSAIWNLQGYLIAEEAEGRQVADIRAMVDKLNRMMEVL